MLNKAQIKLRLEIAKENVEKYKEEELQRQLDIVASNLNATASDYLTLENMVWALLDKTSKLEKENAKLRQAIEEALLDIDSMELTELPQTDQLTIQMMRLRLEQALEGTAEPKECAERTKAVRHDVCATAEGGAQTPAPPKKEGSKYQ